MNPAQIIDKTVANNDTCIQLSSDNVSGNIAFIPSISTAVNASVKNIICSGYHNNHDIKDAVFLYVINSPIMVLFYHNFPIRQSCYVCGVDQTGEVFLMADE